MQYYKDSTNEIHVIPDTSYAHLLPTGCVAITETEATSILEAASALLTTQNAPQLLKSQAQQALDASDLVAIRCLKVGASFPPAWQGYTAALRAIVAGTDRTSTVLPTRPAYPAGT